MEKLKIRDAVKEDLQAIYQIDLRAWNEMSLAYLMEQRYGQIGDEPATIQKARSAYEMFKNSMDNFLVAEIDGKVVGYARFSLDMKQRMGRVGYNAVDPDYRGQGIGTALQRRIQEIFREKGMLYAQVITMEHDLPARRVYEKMGFKELARSVHYAMKLEDGNFDTNIDEKE